MKKTVSISIIMLLCFIFFFAESGCSRFAEKPVEQEDTGLPSFVIQEKTDDCECYSTGKLFATAELGMPIGKVYGFTWKNPQELLSFLQESAKMSGGTVTIRKVDECIQELVSRPQPGPATVSLLIHPKGHVYLLLGTVMIGDVLTFQLVHGDSAVWLVDQKSLEKANFTEAWQFQKNIDGTIFLVGNTPLNIDHHYFNFGKVLPSTQLEAIIHFKNQGKNSLIFQQPQVSCQCTVIDDLSGMELKANESKEFKVAFTTSISASERHSIFLPVVEKGTGVVQRIEILLLASQQQSMSIDPLTIDFGNVHPNEKYTRTINFMEEPTDRFSITGFDPNRTPIQGKYETATSRDGLKTYQLEVIFTPNGSEPDREKDYFVVETNSLLRPKVNIPFSFKLIPEISAEPATISIGSIEIGKTAEEKVKIISQKNEKLECSIKTIPSNCTVDIVRQGNPIELSVKVKPEKSGIWQDKIILAVKTSSREEVLEIECVGYVH
ncbi:MAG: DUF1573 domain-containing protein [Planctomycetaceae bacterium]|jgi:hypothetical protein|nr:DUF1573 domain-containing protein [Planctomycetaceae bacterium]